MNFRFSSTITCLWGGAIILLVYHICVLPFSPLPWFDETYFASMTLHWGKTGEFLPEIGPMLEYYYPQAKAYGPAYFMVIHVIFKLFGFGLLQMRLPGLLFGIIFIIIAERILKISEISRYHRLAFVLLLSFDPIFLQNIHSGRMDSMALLLAGLGTYWLIKGLKSGANFPFFLVGTFFGLAILTTPRIAVPLMGPAFALALYFFRKVNFKSFCQLAMVGVLVFGIYTIWVFWGFGGFPNMWNYFFGQPKEALYFNSLAAGYINSYLYIPKFQIPAILFGIIALIFKILSKRFNYTYLQIVCLVHITAFYLTVNDTGIYSVLVMPFIYIIILLSINQLATKQKQIFNFFIPVLIILNVGLFIFKNLVVLNSIPLRQHSSVEEQIKKLIPKESKVIGDEAFYYATLKAGSDFQYMDRGADGYRRKEYHENVYNYEYAIVKNPPANLSQFEWYKKDRDLKIIGYITMGRPYVENETLTSIFQLLGVTQNTGYNGIVFKR